MATSDDSPRLQAVLWPFKTALYLCLSFVLLGLLSIAFQVAMAKLVWGVPETIRKAETFLARDVERTYRENKPTALTQFAISGAQLGYWTFFKLTRIDQMMRDAAALGNAEPLDRGGDILVRNQLVMRIQDEIHLSMYVVQDFAVRIVLLLSAWPLYLLTFTLGLVDGLAERSIRRACAGRESSSLYHRAKYLQFASFVMTGMIYVLLPYSIRPEWFFIPLAGLLLLLSRIQWTYLKKYL